MKQRSYMPFMTALERYKSSKGVQLRGINCWSAWRARILCGSIDTLEKCLFYMTARTARSRTKSISGG